MPNSEMKLINKHIIWVNKVIEFAVVCQPQYTNNGVSLFSFGTRQLYPNKNYLDQNKMFIEQLENIRRQNNSEENYEFFGFQHELYIKVNANETYAEKWGLSATVPTESFINLFYDLQSFLNRWNNPKDLEAKIRECFVECKNSKNNRKEVFVKNLGDHDQIKLILSDEEKLLSDEAYVKSLAWPIHFNILNREALTSRQEPNSDLSDQFLNGYFISEPEVYEEYHAGHKSQETHFKGYRFYPKNVVAKRFKINDSNYTNEDFDTVRFKGKYVLNQKTIELTFPKGKDHYDIEILTVLGPDTLLDENLKSYTFTPWNLPNTNEPS